jgi:hypothetical protein
MSPVVIMDSHNSSSDNHYTSVQLLRTEGKNNNNNKKNKSRNQITSPSSILARILIVDDEPDVNLQLKMVLERVELLTHSLILSQHFSISNLDFMIWRSLI